MRSVLFCLLFFSPFLGASGMEQTNPKPNKPNVTFKLIVREDKRPEEDLRLIVSPKGKIRDLMSHAIDDKLLKELLRKKSDRVEFSVLLKFGEDDATSVTTMATVLKKIKAFADPQKKTTIYIFIKKLHSKK
jgi:hypothetical protein